MRNSYHKVKDFDNFHLIKYDTYIISLIIYEDLPKQVEENNSWEQVCKHLKYLQVLLFWEKEGSRFIRR